MTAHAIDEVGHLYLWPTAIIALKSSPFPEGLDLAKRPVDGRPVRASSCFAPAADRWPGPGPG